MDDFTAVPDRTNSDLHLDRNNETVVSGMTECSYGLDAPQYSSSEAAAAARRVSNTSMPPSRFRGGTASRLGNRYGGAGSSSGASVSSRGSRIDRSTRSAMSRSQFDTIDEEQDDESVVSGRSGAQSVSGRSRQSYRTAGDDHSIWMGSENASMHQGVQNSSNFGNSNGGGGSVRSGGSVVQSSEGDEGESGFRFSAGFWPGFSSGRSVSSGMSGFNESDDTSIARRGSNPVFGANSISGNSRRGFGGGSNQSETSGSASGHSVSEHGSSKGSFVEFNPQGQGVFNGGGSTSDILPDSQGFNPSTSEMFSVNDDASVVSGISMGRSVASRSIRWNSNVRGNRSSGLASSQFSQQGGSGRPGLGASDKQRSVSSTWNDSVGREREDASNEHSMGGQSITGMWNESVQRREHGESSVAGGISMSQHSMGGQSITSMWNNSVERRMSAEHTGGDLLDDAKSVVSSAQQSVASQRHRPSVPFSRANMAEASHAQEVDGEEEDDVSITKDERDKMLLNAFDNTRYASHNPKDYATQEIDVSYYQEVILDSDETSTLPENYVLDDFGKRYHPSKKDLEAELLRLESNKRDNDRLEILPMSSGGYYDPRHLGQFSKKQRMNSVMTIMAAVALVVVGICMSISSLSSPVGGKQEQRTNSNVGNNGGYLYLPQGYQFGGGSGGIEGGQEMERRKQLAQDYLGIGWQQQQQAPPVDHAANAAPAGFAPMVENSESSSGGGYSGGRNDYQGRGVDTQGIASYQIRGGEDPYGGLGPPQFNPDLGSAMLPPLTSAPLTSYAPPPNDDGTVIVLEESFHGSIQELSVLPYNPHLEMPVVLDIPLSGGAATKQIFGNCLKMVQCTERGRDILAREHSLHKGEAVDDESSVTRYLSSQEEDSSVTASKINHLRITPKRHLEENGATDASSTTFDPPLRTEVVYTSTYVNVDCTNPSGIDRGIARDLARSDMADVLYSPDIHDVARLFAPPIMSYGRGVALIRNPLERAVAKYNWLRNIDNTVKEMSLEDFANSGE